MNITESLLHALAARGARQIFGIPGDFALPYFRVIEESGILPLYTLSHEPAVGFAADAAARIGTLGVAAVTYGAGALNMINAVAAAYAEKSPVVVLSGGPGRSESNSGLLLHHQAKRLDSQFRIYEEITCERVRLDDAARAPADIARALDQCRSQSRPVYIEIPRDMVAMPCEAVPGPGPGAEPDPDALAACAEEILAHLGRATSPVLVVDVEVRRFGLERKVAELAARLSMPVATCFMGRGLLADSDASLVGTYMGVAGVPEVTRLVEHSDGLFLLGVILSDTNFAVSEKRIDMRKSIVACDGEVRLGHHIYPAIPLGALVDALLQRTQPRPAALRVPRATYPRGMVADDAPIAPSDIATAVNDLMAVHGKFPIACDVGDCLFTAMDIEHTALVAPGYYATMGFGVPAGLGLQAATGQRPLVLVGDGAFQMTGWELGNCARYGWDPIVLLFNNSGWEMLRTFQPESRFNDIDPWAFAELARGLGGEGMRVTTRRELRDALERAVRTRGRFQLVEIVIPPGVLSPTLQRYVAGVKRITQGPATGAA